VTFSSTSRATITGGPGGAPPTRWGRPGWRGCARSGRRCWSAG
jgi:hypothetical protein